MPTLLVIDITLPEDRGEAAAAFLAAEAGTGWEELSAEPGTTTYRLHYADHGAGRALLERAEHRWPDARTALSQREEENWAMAWK
ncbi:MAG: 50S ribosomal protein L11 methyltransferase, partial [Desulfovibrionaceae bacterium]